MGQKISDCCAGMAKQLGTAMSLFFIPGCYPKNYVHHQYYRRLSPAGKKGNKDEGRFYFRYSPVEAHLPCYNPNGRKMETMHSRLALNSLTAQADLWRAISNTNEPNYQLTMRFIKAYMTRLILQKNVLLLATRFRSIQSVEISLTRLLASRARLCFSQQLKLQFSADTVYFTLPIVIP